MIKLKSIWVFVFVSIISCNTIAESLVSTDEVMHPCQLFQKMSSILYGLIYAAVFFQYVVVGLLIR